MAVQNSVQANVGAVDGLYGMLTLREGVVKVVE
jgi:hypothetical protein